MLFNRLMDRINFEEDGQVSEPVQKGSEGLPAGTREVIHNGKRIQISEEPKKDSDGLFSIKVNGKEKQVTKEELIVLAQKADAADEKFQEAAKIQKEKEAIVSALKKMQAEGDVDAFEKVFDKGFVEKVKAKYSTKEDKEESIEIPLAKKRQAEHLGITVEELLESEHIASGNDNPAVLELKEEIAKLQKLVEEKTKETSKTNPISNDLDAKKMYDHFESLTEKYGFDAEMAEIVLTQIERNQVLPSKYEDEFKKMDAILNKGVNGYIEKKTKGTKILGVNDSSEASVFKREDYKGKSFSERIKMLKEIGS